MTKSDAFSPDEWKLLLEAPTSAGMIVVTASRGGTFRESFAMSKAYVEARSEHGKSELLDQIVGSKPKTDHTRPHSAAELKAHGLQHLTDAVALLDSKATPQEVADYKQFVLILAQKVASAHREEGQAVSPSEAEAIKEIESALVATGD
jgi:hypothetical protein